MKKIFAIAVLGLILISCKKSSPGGGPSISATINDTAYSFTQAFKGTVYNDGRRVALYAANSTNAATATELYIDLESNLALTPGVYSDTANQGVSLPIIYRHTSFDVHPYITPQSGIDYNFGSIGLTSNPFIVTVTSVTPTSIQGTFSGKLYLDGVSATTADSIKVITNGKFNATLIIQN